MSETKIIRVAVYEDMPRRYTRSGKLVPINTYCGIDNQPRLLALAMHLAKFRKAAGAERVWIGERFEEEE